MAGKKRELTEEQRAALRERLAKARAARKSRPTDEEILMSKTVAELNETPPSVAAERRARMLKGIDPEVAAQISDDRLAKIEEEERKVAEEERVAKALALIREGERKKARAENDLIPPEQLRSEAEKVFLNEPVTFKVTLPDSGAGRGERAGFRVNGFLYEIGATYTRPRHVFISLHANHYGAWLSEVKFRTLDQHKPGMDARSIVGNHIPAFEVRLA